MGGRERRVEGGMESKGHCPPWFSPQVCLVPESAHGTNAASAQMAGLHVEYVKMDKDGSISVDTFKAKVMHPLAHEPGVCPEGPLVRHPLHCSFWTIPGFCRF